MTPKCITNHREMSMKKHKFRSCNAQKRTPSTDLQNCIKTRSLLSLPVLLCARHGCKNRSKSLKFYHKITTKSTNAVVAIARNARCRPTCEHASKRVDFVVPAVALLTPWMQNSFKIVENHRWQHVICRRSCPPRGGPMRSV